MNSERSEFAVVGIGMAYLAALSWAITNLAYDIWGALIVAPIYGLLGFMAMRRLFRDSGQGVARAMCWGLLIKLGGAGARYWVGFEAYGGGIDAARYHRYAIDASGAFWSGDADLWSVLPSGSGTAFLERLTAFVYTFTGGSQLAGFITFAFLAYLGTALLVKAALIAIPGMAARRYAWLCALAPSLVYWPASIGKEAAVLLGLGLATYGFATFISKGTLFFPIVFVAAGIVLVSAVRVHIAGLWVAAAIPGLAVALVLRSPDPGRERPRRKGHRVSVLVVIGIAAIGLAAISSTTVRYLSPDNVDGESTHATDTDSVTQILEETTRRSTKSGSGSTFEPPSVASPASWPYASIRTLTRPLPFEARSAAALVSAAEMMLLLGLFVIYRRNFLNLPRMLARNGYVAFSVVLLFIGGLAYSSFGNMGILARQKSLLFPFLLLLACLPARTRRVVPEISMPTPPTELGVTRATTPPPLDNPRPPRSSDDLWV